MTVEVISGGGFLIAGDIVPDIATANVGIPFAPVIPGDFGPEPTTGIAAALAPNFAGPSDFSGVHRIEGTVKEKGSPANVPLERLVLLIDEVTGIPVQQTVSDKTTGAYVFTNINGARKFTVISYDHTGYHRAVIANNLTPEPMP